LQKDHGLTDIRSDGEERGWRCGQRRGAPAVRERDGERWSITGGTRNRDSGLGFGSDLDWEVARVTGNPIGGLRGWDGGRRRRPTASGDGEPSVMFVRARGKLRS
jgi:hypothetical protein